MGKDKFEEFKRQVPGVREGVSLKEYTTFKIGGAARYFFVAKTSGDIQKAVRAAKKLGMRYFLLSGGSNVLFSDAGFPGLVIRVRASRFTFHGSQLRAEAGAEMATVVRETGRRGLRGLEWAGGLPGTVGGAVRGNAGAFGGETKDSIVEVEAYGAAKGNRKTFSRKECGFGYRTSIFKKKNLVVLSAVFQLRKGNKQTIQAVAKARIAYRKERHPLEYPNAGSIFKNCDVEKVPRKVAREFADVVKQDPFPVIPTAALIAAANLQGLRVGDAEVSKKHPNYIVNRGGASAKDVLELIARVKKEIKNNFGVRLEEEITFSH